MLVLAVGLQPAYSASAAHASFVFTLIGMANGLDAIGYWLTGLQD